MTDLTRRGLFGAFAGLAGLPVVGRLFPAAAAPSSVPVDIYGRGPMLNALRGIPIRKPYVVEFDYADLREGRMSLAEWGQTLTPAEIEDAYGGLFDAIEAVDD